MTSMKSRSWVNRLLGGDPVTALAPLVAALLALGVGALILLALGKNPIEAYGAMLEGAFGSDRNLFRPHGRRRTGFAPASIKAMF